MRGLGIRLGLRGGKINEGPTELPNIRLWPVRHPHRNLFLEFPLHVDPPFWLLVASLQLSALYYELQACNRQ
jgi:hypothetical protein